MGQVKISVVLLKFQFYTSINQNRHSPLTALVLDFSSLCVINILFPNPFKELNRKGIKEQVN